MSRRSETSPTQMQQEQTHKNPDTRTGSAFPHVNEVAIAISDRLHDLRRPSLISRQAAVTHHLKVGFALGLDRVSCYTVNELIQ